MRAVPLQERHLDEAARLETLCFSRPWSRQALAEELENPTAVFMAAEDDAGELLGYAGMHVVCGEGYIDNVAVFPEARRRGVGRLLVQSLVQWIREHEGVFLTLEVRPSNEPAISLYGSLGFEEVGRRPRFYECPTEDALLMTLYLA